MQPTISRRTSRALSPGAIVVALLSALLLFAAVAVAAPHRALGASVTTANCTANLRASASVSATARGSVVSGTNVTVAATVMGGAWKASCAGATVSGSAWYRISAINGKSVSSIYGVSYLYAAAGLFKPLVATTTTAQSLCTANLRSTASVAGARVASVPAGTKVSVSAVVTGGSWKATCAGATVSGSTWYRITAVNGQSVRSRYGVSVVYAAAGLFKKVALPTTPAAQTLYASCDNVSVRSTASTSGTLKARLAAGTKVNVIASAAGGAWSAECAGKSASGSTWYRINAIDGKSTSSLYGLSYVYAASGLFSASAPAATPTPTQPPAPPPPPAMLEGIDVSHWQGAIDWAKVRGAGKRFAFLKSSEDHDYVDPTYATNRSRARAAGVVVGAYHFAQPSAVTGDAVAEADHFVRTAAIADGDLLPVLDLEVTGGLGPSALQTWTRTFLQRVYEKTGVRAGIYVSPAFWKVSMGDTTWFAANGYKVLWTAHWTTASSPAVPANNWGGRGWTFWQYSATGAVPGISGNVDLNRYNGGDLAPVLVP